MLSSYVLFSVYNQCLYKAVVAASAEHSMRTAVKEVQAVQGRTGRGKVCFEIFAKQCTLLILCSGSSPTPGTTPQPTPSTPQCHVCPEGTAQCILAVVIINGVQHTEDRGSLDHLAS